MIKMKNLIDVISMGPFGSDIKVEFFVDEGVPVLNGANISSVKLTEESFRYVTEAKADSLKKAIATPGDIVVTHRGTLGQIAYIPKNASHQRYVISQSQFRVKLKAEYVDYRFFTYYFHSPEGQRRLLANKSYVGVPALAQATTNFRLIDFPMKSLKTQKKIADVLSTLDAKIDLNNRINAELESLARTIYDYWFLQFDFPGADGRPYRSSGGEMKLDVETGWMIPKNWDIRSLADIANITMGQSPPGASLNLDKNGTVFYQGCTDFTDRFPVNRLFTTEPKRMAVAGDILLSVRAPVGTLNIANEDCCIGRGVAALSSKTGHDDFLFYVLSYLKTVFDRRNTDGTTFGSITKADLHSLKVVVPPIEVLDNFRSLVNSGSEMINNNSYESRHLSALRDWLLPLLMSGEVVVEE